MSRPRKRGRLEDGLKLDLNKLLRQRLVRSGAACRSTIHWNYCDSGKEIVSGRLSSDMTAANSGWLRIEIDSLNIFQWIELVATPRHFGGVQWYCICPRTGRRASTVWKPPGEQFFASRHTWHVAYGSQFQSRYDRAVTAAQDIRYRLAGKDFLCVFDGPPPKPKWMRWHTYEKIMQRCDAYEAEVRQHLFEFLQKKPGFDNMFRLAGTNYRSLS
jgi:hypothetical protein